MKYKFTDGIVYTKICKVPILVATRKVWDKFPSAKRVSPLQGCFCQGIEANMDEDELINAIILPPKMKRETIKKKYDIFINKMIDEGYIVPESSL